MAVIAGSDAAHSGESPLNIIRDVHTIIAMAERGDSLSLKAIVVGDRPPDIQIKPLLVPQRIGTNGDYIAALSNLGMWRNDITACDKPTRTNEKFPVSVISEVVFDKPFSVCRRKIASIANFDVSDRFVAISKHVDTDRPYAYISPLENVGIFSLSASDGGKCNGKEANHERKQCSDFVVIGLNESVSEPIPINPENIKHGKTSLFIMVFCLSLVAFVWWIFS
jgi:hypothetical protein